MRKITFTSLCDCCVELVRGCIYPRELRLPDLLAALNEYETWDALVMAVYGVSRGEFGLGWQESIATQFPSPE